MSTVSREASLTRIEHITIKGTMFRCERADLSTVVTVHTDTEDVDPLKFAREVSEFIGWHALWVHPTLASFRGYDCVTYKFELYQDG